MKKILLLPPAVITLMLLAGFSKTAPIRGTFVSDSRTFKGTATGYVTGRGELTIQTSNGIHCTGRFARVTHTKGKGTMTCSDGRSMPFVFFSHGVSGNGVGQIGDEQITFTFGKEPIH